MKRVDWDKNMDELTALAESEQRAGRSLVVDSITSAAAVIALASLVCNLGHELQNLVEEVSRIRKGEH